MKKYLAKSKELLESSAGRLSTEIGSKLDVLKGAIGEIPIFMSLVRSSDCGIEYDEKHYFIVPFKLSEVGFSLHTMRYLPASVPEINDLPKRRIFHFPSEHYEGSLRELMKSSARDLVEQKSDGRKSKLEELADSIDAWDSKLTYGMLFVGGLTAFLNPLLGAGIAAKAVLPSVTGTLTKFGLRSASEKLTQSQLRQVTKQAEKKVLKQFSESNTLRVVNPILQELDLALSTTAEQHDPLLDPNLSAGSIPELHGEHWRKLTEQAVYHVYKDTYEDASRHQAACLGPEDIRWLDVLFACVTENKRQ